jgi:hypothetical protein
MFLSIGQYLRHETGLWRDRRLITGECIAQDAHREKRVLDRQAP